MATVPTFDGAPAAQWPVAVPPPQGPPVAPFDPRVWRPEDFNELREMAAERQRREVFSRFVGEQFDPPPASRAGAVNVPPPQVRGQFDAATGRNLIPGAQFNGMTGQPLNSVRPTAVAPPVARMAPPVPPPQARPVGFAGNAGAGQAAPTARPSAPGFAGVPRVPGAQVGGFGFAGNASGSALPPSPAGSAAAGATGWRSRIPRVTVPGTGRLASIGNRQMPGMGWGGASRSAVLSATGNSSLPRLIPAANTPGASGVARFFNGTGAGRFARGVGVPMAVGTALGYAQDPIVDALGGDQSVAGQIADSTIGGARVGMWAGPVGAAVGAAGAGIGQAVTEVFQRGDDDRGSLPDILANTGNPVGELLGGMAGGTKETGLNLDIGGARAQLASSDPQRFQAEFTRFGLDDATTAEVWDQFNTEAELSLAMFESDPVGWRQAYGWPEDAPNPTEDDIRRSMYANVIQAVPEILAAKEAESEQQQRAAAFQMAAANWMQPYQDAAYQRADMNRQIMGSVIPNMPAQYQPVAQMYAEQSALGAEAMADAYGASARMLPQLSALEAYLSMPPPQEETAEPSEAEMAALLAEMGG